MLEDIEEDRQKVAQKIAITRRFEISSGRMKEPQGRVGGVVDALVGMVGEEVGDEPLLDVGGEGAKDRCGLVRPAGGSRALASFVPSQGGAKRASAPLGMGMRRPDVVGDLMKKDAYT